MPIASVGAARACQAKGALALSLCAAVASANAAGFSSSTADFAAACANVSQGGPPNQLPAGWTFSKGVGGDSATLSCDDTNGLGIKNPGGDTQLYTWLPLSTGTYVLTAAGAGSAFVIVRKDFDDYSFHRLTTLVNVDSTSPIMNQTEFTWDGVNSSQALVQVWESNLQWLRLERRPDAPTPLTLPIPLSLSNMKGWTVTANTVTIAPVALNTAVKVTPKNGATAAIRKTFALPAGRYELSTTTRGNVDVKLTTGPDLVRTFVTLDRSQSSTLNQDLVLSQRFNASGQNITVTLVARAPNTALQFKNMTLKPVVDQPPTPAQLAAPGNRPSPWPARGLTASSITQLLPSSPRDLAGQVCPNDPKDPNNPRIDRSTDFADMKAWGAQIVRIDVPTVSRARLANCLLVAPTDIGQDGISVDPTAFWSKAWPRILEETAQTVQAAGNAGLKVVLLMEPPTPSAVLSNKPGGWVNLKARQEFARGMADLVGRLAPLRQNVWAYDLLNEPSESIPGIGNVPASQWRTLAIDVIAAMRAKEASLGIQPSGRSWVVFEPGLFPSSSWLEEYAALKPLPDTRVLYSEHFYDPHSFTHQNISCPGNMGYPVGTQAYTGSTAEIRAKLQPLSDFSSRTGAPVYIGEFGAAVWAGWSEVLGPNGLSQDPKVWKPRLDANGQPIFDNVNWLRDVMDVIEPFGFAWTQHSFRTYYAWDSEITPDHGPCGPYSYYLPGQPETPTMVLMKAYLSRR